MKKLIILIYIILITNVIQSQSIAKLNNKKLELQKTKDKLSNQIMTINEEIEVINSEIYSLKAKEIKNDTSKVLIQTVAFEGSKVFKEPSTSSEVLKILNKRSDIFVTDYKDNFYEVLSDGVKGFIVTGRVDEVANDVYKVKEKGYIFEKEEMSVKYEKERVIHKNKKDELKGSGKLWVGMTKDEARLSLGKPRYDNRSVGSWGTHNQWVYKYYNLYFENGKLTSWQD